MTDLTVIGKIKEMMWERPAQTLPKARSHHPSYSAGQQSLQRPHLQLTAFSWPGGRLLPGHMLGTHMRRSQTGEDLPRNDPETKPPLPGLLGTALACYAYSPAPAPGRKGIGPQWPIGAPALQCTGYTPSCLPAPVPGVLQSFRDELNAAASFRREHNCACAESPLQ